MGVGGERGGEGCTGMTSRPMPSPGRRPIRRARVAIELDEREGGGVRRYRSVPCHVNCRQPSTYESGADRTQNIEKIHF